MTDSENTPFNIEGKFDSFEAWVLQYKKPLMIGGSVLVGAALIFSVLKFWYIPSQEDDAELSMRHAQTWFAMDSVNKAIKGDGANLGFLDIADQYSWTPAGHLANYYAGICYYEKKDYAKAIDCLDKFNSGDILVSPIAIGVMGDAEMQLGNTAKALEDYQAAIKRNDNNLTAPIFTKKAALACEMQGDYAQALQYYQVIKSKYSSSAEAADIDKYIARAKIKAGNK